MLVAAFAAVTMSFTFTSCGNDEPANLSKFTIKGDVQFQGLSADEVAEFQPFIDKLAKPTTTDVAITLDAAKLQVDLGIQTMRASFVPFVSLLDNGQKITFTLNLYKGENATGTAVYSKQIITDHLGVTVK